jgi:prepilin-type N-terminal cleavage/methylation domain-containing protein
MKLGNMNNKRQTGFTIVELMIATTVLAVILLLVTIMMTNIGNLYYRGVNQSRLQDDVRTVTSQISQNLELNDETVSSATVANAYGTTTTMYAYCVGDTRYSYVLNLQIGTASTQSEHVLWRDTYTKACTPIDLAKAQPESGTNAGTNGVELIAPNSLLTAFSISASSPFTISMGMAYGVTGSKGVLNLNGTSSTCKNGKGDDFCATASLTTTVVQRIT